MAFTETAEVVFGEMATCAGCKLTVPSPPPEDWFRIVRPLPGVMAMLACSPNCLLEVGRQAVEITRGKGGRGALDHPCYEGHHCEAQARA